MDALLFILFLFLTLENAREEKRSFFIFFFLSLSILFFLLQKQVDDAPKKKKTTLSRHTLSRVLHLVYLFVGLGNSIRVSQCILGCSSNNKGST
jgi:hypothetical protein